MSAWQHRFYDRTVVTFLQKVIRSFEILELSEEGRLTLCQTTACNNRHGDKEATLKSNSDLVEKKLVEDELGNKGTVQEALTVIKEVKRLKRGPNRLERMLHRKPNEPVKVQKHNICEECQLCIGLDDNEQRIANHGSGRLQHYDTRRNIAELAASRETSQMPGDWSRLDVAQQYANQSTGPTAGEFPFQFPVQLTQQHQLPNPKPQQPQLLRGIGSSCTDLLQAAAALGTLAWFLCDPTIFKNSSNASAATCFNGRVGCRGRRKQQLYVSLMMFPAAGFMATSAGPRRQGSRVTYMIRSSSTRPRQSPREMFPAAGIQRHDSGHPKCVACHKEFSSEHDCVVDRRRHTGERPLQRSRPTNDTLLPDPIVADQPAPVAQRYFSAYDPATRRWQFHVRHLSQGARQHVLLSLSGAPEAAGTRRRRSCSCVGVEHGSRSPFRGTSCDRSFNEGCLFRPAGPAPTRRRLLPGFVPVALVRGTEVQGTCAWLRHKSAAVHPSVCADEGCTSPFSHSART
ncbi:hypothetical protein HPB50_008923 [Hyalomma asiaticum]|uniref:Uncharacterized protein n=1 Tax=Hyalomma asiaticum TaxID=266040 RepID=A0ACB7TJK3_HYAAI|nr:hypothetical protein HPB50_008923 [Hyalomma asiaticum]